MPTYEYRCADCGEHLEAVQSFSDDPLTVCPACGGVLKKKFNAVGISFKGSGFYKTDSRSSAGASSSGSSDGGSSGSESSDSGSSDGSSGSGSSPDSSSSTTTASSSSGSSSGSS
jgi:putative FmdB family regulatory protein